MFIAPDNPAFEDWYGSKLEPQDPICEECEHNEPGQLCPECDGYAYELYLESRSER